MSGSNMFKNETLSVKTFKVKKSAPTATDTDATTSPSKSSNNENNSHNSLPVKQSIAIALASKLNKKNTTTSTLSSQQHQHGGNDIELPKLIPIASEPVGSSFKEQLFNESLHPVLAPYEGDHFMNSDILLDTPNIVEDVEESILANAVVSSVFTLFTQKDVLKGGAGRAYLYLSNHVSLKIGRAPVPSQLQVTLGLWYLWLRFDNLWVRLVSSQYLSYTSRFARVR